MTTYNGSPPSAESPSPSEIEASSDPAPRPFAP